MAVLTIHRLVLLLALIATITIPALADEDDKSGKRGRIDHGECPPNVEAVMVYSPFKPYYHWAEFQHIQKCWVASDCLFEAAGESRKQQFAAVALVMGLVPPTLKDIAWPERRGIPITKKLNPLVEILVLALGLVPAITADSPESIAKSKASSFIVRKSWKMSKPKKAFWIFVCTIGLLASYTGLVITEVFSKRSALGCVFPGTVAAWFAIALLPAAIHALFASFDRSRNAAIKSSTPPFQTDPNKNPHDVEAREARQMLEMDHQQSRPVMSAVPGGDEGWPVQLSWAVYYIAGILVFTSIMAVTVIELLVWVLLGIAATGCSKLLAFFLCVYFEETVHG